MIMPWPTTILVILMMGLLSWGAWWRGYIEMERKCIVERLDAGPVDPPLFQQRRRMLTPG